MSYTSNFIKNTHDYIHACRFKKGHLEKSIGVSVGYLSRCENGVFDIPLEKACKIANYLGVTVDDLVTGKCMKDVLIAEKESLEKRISEIESLISREAEGKKNEGT